MNDALPHGHAITAQDETPARDAWRAAQTANEAWQATPLKTRLAVIEAARRLVKRDAHALGQLTSDVTARPLADSLSAEVLPTLDAARYLLRDAGRVLAEYRPNERLRPRWLTATTLSVRRLPLGVVLILAPSNYPLMLPAVQALQALAAGNTVLLKPAPGCGPPLQRFVDLLTEAGLPVGACALIPETVEAAKAVIAAGVDHVVLTGSATTGKAVLADLAPTLTPATMELSGADALIALDGAEVDLVVAAAAFGLTFSGSRTCIAPRRLYAPQDMLPAIEASLAARLAEAPTVTLGPTIREAVMTRAEQALQAGGRIAHGALPQEGAPFAPLVLTNVPDGAPSFDTDLFAPVLALSPYRTVDAAVGWVNGAAYGLGASVFGPNEAATAIARRLNVGCVTVNDVIAPIADPRLPFGGRGLSGFGTTRGAEGLLAMTRPQAQVVRRATKHPHLRATRLPAWLALRLVKWLH